MTSLSHWLSALDDKSFSWLSSDMTSLSHWLSASVDKFFSWLSSNMVSLSLGCLFELTNLARISHFGCSCLSEKTSLVLASLALGFLPQN